MNKLIFLLLLFIIQTSFGQEKNVWIRFYDTSTELSGYKDLKGNTRIPAKFHSLTRADTFYNIIAAIDSSDKYYYLLKDGRKIGRDSVFMFDFEADCEREGKIIFYDRKKDRVGFFDSKGVAIIPAVYNYASPFRNGFSIAHRNAKRKCWDGNDDTTRCEHLGWEGGETILINDKNEIIADSINIDLSNINWYSKRINDLSVDTSIFVSLKGKDNNIYSFVDYRKEFTKWFYNKYLPNINSDHPENLLFSEVTFWSDKTGWTSLKAGDFIKAFRSVFSSERLQSNKVKQISIDAELFNELIYDKALYKKYLNSCGEHNRERFPLFNVLITYYKERQKPVTDTPSDFFKKYEIDYQEGFDFLRTENGYRLLSVSVKQ